MKIFYGNFIRNIDDKGRLSLPKKIELTTNDKIIYVKDNSNYRIYLIEMFNHIIEELKNKKFIANNEIQLKLIEHELEFLLNNNLDTSTVDKQQRILIPQSIRSEFEIGYANIQGRYDHLMISPISNEEIEIQKNKGLIK